MRRVKKNISEEKFTACRLPLIAENIYIELTNISKTYEKSSLPAVKNVNFDVEKGEIFGMIGADGAGKTSIFRMLTTLLLPDSGSAKVLGYNVVKDYQEIRKEVGYMPGRFSLYQDLSVEENLNFYATLFGTTVEENIDLIRDIYVQIEPFKKRRAGKLSGGMKQKLALCCALIHKPRVLFLDEPTTGIDPVSRKELWEMLRKLKQEDIAILVSTPYMDEALQCDRIGLMKNGEMMKIDTPQNMINSYYKPLYAVYSDNIFHLLQILEKYPNRINSYAFGDKVHVIVDKSEKELFDYLTEKNFKDIQIEKIKPTVEDCFIDLS